MIRRTLILLSIAVASASGADLPPMRQAPTRPPEGPSVVMEEFEVLPDCAAEKVCAEGLIRNVGLKTAHQIRLRIEVGGTKYGKPRTFFYQEVDKNVMESTEAQSVSIIVPRKHPYKDAKGEEKVIEIGRYNFKVVPVWKDAPKPAAPPKRLAPKK